MAGLHRAATGRGGDRAVGEREHIASAGGDSGGLVHDGFKLNRDS